LNRTFAVPSPPENGPPDKEESFLKTDAPLKALFREYARDLLGLLGDAGASLVAVENVEIQQIERRVDSLLKLERQGEIYYRHVEFQAEDAPDMARRCFEYNALLLMRYGAPVLTTVVYLRHDEYDKR
jgi:predicted transposase YdaD